MYVVPFGGGQGKWQVSANGGTRPQWGTDETLVSSWSAPQVFYDVAPDGKKILLVRVAQQVSQSVTVVANFFAELKK